MAHRRYIDSSAAPDAWMTIPFLFRFVLGFYVFSKADDIPVTIGFVGLALVCATEIRVRFASWRGGSRLVGLWQCLTGVWLRYSTWAITVNLALGYKAWV
jgi:hypothetical protein